MTLGPSSVEFEAKEPNNPWNAPECIHCGKLLVFHWQTANGRIWCTQECSKPTANPSEDCQVTFARGARVRKPLDRELTLIEASFVMCSVAHRDGLGSEEKFVEYMRRAWINYVAAGSENNTGGK